jgi:hypothetical protein
MAVLLNGVRFLSNGVMLRQYVHHVNWGCVVCWRRSLGHGDVAVIRKP